MELGNDLMDALRQRICGARADQTAAALDWPGLRARLVAARAVRSVLQADDASFVSVRGSFAPAAAACLSTTGDGLAVVNPFASADRKACAGNDAAFAGIGNPAMREC
jgi:hypothetical protein